MRKIILVFGLLLTIVSAVTAQCPTAGYTVPDSVCANTPFQITNTSAPGMEYYWDLCPGDLQTLPTENLLPLDPGLAGPQQIRLIKDNGNYHLFVANLFGNNVLRYDFGTSLDNTPVVYDYGGMGFSNPAGIDVISENGIWYALISNYTGGAISRVDLGSNISANIATATSLGTFGLTAPMSLKIAFDGANYYGFVTSSVGTILTRIEFGNSITNTPTGSTALTDAAFDGGWGFDIAFDCSLNKWIGFLASTVQNNISVIDFGNSPANNFTLATAIPCGVTTTSLNIARDGAAWHLLSVSIGSAALQNYKFTSNLLSITTPMALPSMSLTSPRGVTFYRDSTSFKVFASLNNGNNITKFNFQKPCFASPAISFDPGSVNPTITSSNNYHEITLEVTGPNGEITVFSDSVFIQNTPAAGFITSPACEGQPVQFTDTSVVDTSLVINWLWDFGDTSSGSTDQNPVHTYSTTGTYGVSLTTSYTGGCTNSTIDSITISPLPDAAFTFPNNQCSQSPVQFTDMSQAFAGATISSWIWNFGDTTALDASQNPIHTYSAGGTYSVVLIVVASTGCTDSIVQTITIIPAPEAHFTVNSTCVGETVNFINTTTIQGPQTITYNWDFGDTFTDTATDPSHAYSPVTGNYLVTLIANASNGCNDTFSDSIRIAEKPVPQFSWTPPIVCVGNTVVFSNTSTGSGTDTIALHVWDFGDSITSTDINPTHAYADTGTYQVTLTVLSLTDCDSSISQTINVISAPTASFTANSVCLNLATNFNPSVTTPPGTVVDSIVWTYGDGNGFTGTSSPTHTYLNPGSYEVIMTVYNDLLCTGTFIDTVQVYPLPTANFTTSLVCSGAPTTFDGTSSVIVNDFISSWTWDFNGIGTATDSITQFVFQNAGPYNVTLIVYSSHSCSDTIQKPIEVSASPDFDFVYNEPCFGTAANFTFIPNVTPPPSADLIWDFGDSSQSFLLNPSHVYTTVDTFLVNLTVTEDSSGCTANHVKQLVIRPLPAAGFTATGFCEQQPVTLIDTSVISTGSIVSWNWNLGIFGTSTQMNPVIVPSTAGIYFFNLSVTSDFGCVASTNGNHTVYAKPNAVIVPDPMFGAPPLSVNFINNTTGAISYYWDFDDNTNDNGISPTHLFADTGNYAVTMIATSSQGCIDTVIANVSVVVPYLDLEVSEISYTRLQDQFKISALISNKGFLTITSFQIREKLDQNSILTEPWQGTLLPGTQVFYTFQSSYMINSTFNPEYYCVEAIYPNDTEDDNPSNNSLCKVISSNFEIFSVYPNPFNEVLTINFNLDSEGPVDMEIYDMAGKLILNSPANTGTEGYNSITTQVNQLAKGAYAILLRFRDEEKRILAVKIK